MIGNENENVTMLELDNGNVLLLMDEHLKQVVKDIADPNKKATKARQILLTLTFVPSKSRREAEFSYDVKLKPGPHTDREKTTLHLGKNEKGEIIAKPWVPNQQSLPGVEEAEKANAADRSN